MFKDRIRWIDIKVLFLISLCYVPAFTYRLFNKDIWLCSERKDEARDNGYWMYKYIRDNHPEQNCYYVISKNSFDRNKIEKYKTLINWGSLKHYFIFIATRVRLSAHVNADTPNFRITNFLEKHHLLFNKRVFLQHGVTKDKISFGYYDVSRADLLTCASIREYEFCKKEFGYPDGNVVLTGLARFDGLIDDSKDKNIICVVPTWRTWLKNVDEKIFLESEYYIRYISLLRSKELITLLDEKSLTLIFYLHPEMQKYRHLFDNTDERIVVVDPNGYDMQQLLCGSKLLITDYSSVAFDFAYLNKPIIYYQFDYNRYRRYQHLDGYYNYEKDGFGPVATNSKDLFTSLIFYLSNFANNHNNRNYKNRTVFKFFDNNNCNRIFEVVRKMK